MNVMAMTAANPIAPIQIRSWTRRTFSSCSSTVNSSMRSWAVPSRLAPRPRSESRKPGGVGSCASMIMAGLAAAQQRADHHAHAQRDGEGFVGMGADRVIGGLGAGDDLVAGGLVEFLEALLRVVQALAHGLGFLADILAGGVAHHVLGFMEHFAQVRDELFGGFGVSVAFFHGWSGFGLRDEHGSRPREGKGLRWYLY